MSTSSTLLTAVIAAATALVVAVLTQVITWRRERTERTYDRRRAALLDAQDAALALRNRLAEWGRFDFQAAGERPSALEHAARLAAIDAAALLEVRLTRVDDDAVSAAVAQWRDLASYHSISAEEITARREPEAWRAMNVRFGAALQSARGRS